MRNEEKAREIIAVSNTKEVQEYNKKIFMQKIKVGTLFSGYDAQLLALERLKRDFYNFEYECVFWCEIDKHAISAHNALFPELSDKNIGDITKVEPKELPDVDLITWSFPCTDISQAGAQRGLKKESDTRSSLCWWAIEIFKRKRPKYLIMENVSALVSKKFINDFHNIMLELENCGYKNFAQVLNARDYNTPQNRARIFMVSILDENAKFEFPQPMPLTRKLKDVLEKDVDERYYLSEERLQGLKISTQKEKDAGRGFAFKPKNENDMQKNAYRGSVEGISPTITSACGMGGGQTPMITEVLGWVRDDMGNVVKRPAVEVANCVTAGKRDNTQNYVREQIPLNTDKDGLATTVTTAHHYSGNIVDPKRGQKEMGVLETHQSLPIRVRRLTERELFRLMDLSEEDIDKIQAAGISKTQQEIIAGNSIVVSCLYHIFRKMFIDTEREEAQLTLF